MSKKHIIAAVITLAAVIAGLLILSPAFQHGYVNGRTCAHIKELTKADVADEFILPKTWRYMIDYEHMSSDQAVATIEDSIAVTCPKYSYLLDEDAER